MSYILDALNKSEQEQKNRQAPGLDAIHSLPGQNQKGLWIAIACAFLITNAGLYFFLATEDESLPVQPSVATSEISNTPAVEPAFSEPKQTTPMTTELSTSSPTSIPNSAPVTKPINDETVALTTANIAALPARVQRQIPDMTFSSHIFADDPALRMVNINGRLINEGDVIAEGIKLLRITEDGVVISYRHYNIEMSVIRDWAFD